MSPTNGQEEEIDNDDERMPRLELPPAVAHGEGARGPLEKIGSARCSGFWFWLGTLLHVGCTMILLGYFLGAMVPMHQDFPNETAFWKSIMWVWSPSLAASLEGEMSSAGIGLILLWPVLVGFVVGFLAPPIIRRWRRRWTRLPSVTARWASPILLIVTCWDGWLYYRQFIAEERGFNLRDRVAFQAVTGGIRRTSTFTLYEGLPHQMGEADALAEELKTKETVEIAGYPFYARTLSVPPEDAETLRRLVTSSGTYGSWRGPKLCGGFHPDYCLTWNEGVRVYRLQVCFGCDEIAFENGKWQMMAELRVERVKKLKEILGRYEGQRPKRPAVEVPVGFGE